VIVGPGKTTAKRADFAKAGARVLLQGHQPVAAACKALREVYAHLYGGGAASELADKVLPAKEMDALVSGAEYKQYLRDYMR